METAPFFPGLSILQTAQVGLASASPRRRELLARLLPAQAFEVVPADLDESRLPNEDPATYVERLALEKAAEGARRWAAQSAATGPRLIIAADTSVVVGQVIYGKPTDGSDAAQMLRELSGRTHEVLTGFAVRLINAKGELVRQERTVCTTLVEIRSLSEAEIEWYIATDEPMGKAGAYAVQGFGGTLVRTIQGDYYNVVGLPLVPLIEMLTGFNL